MDWDFDFDDILKEYGSASEEEETPEEETPEEEIPEEEPPKEEPPKQVPVRKAAPVKRRVIEEPEEDDEEDEEEPVPARATRRVKRDAAPAAKESPQRRAKRTIPEEEPERPRQKKRGHGTAALLIFLLILFGIAGGGIYAGIRVSDSETIFPNVSVGNIDVSGLTEAEALEKLQSSGWQERVDTKLTVKTYSDVTVEVDPKEAGTVLDTRDAASAAYQYGHDGNIVENLVCYVKSLAGSVDVNAESTAINTAYITQQAELCQQELDAALGSDAYVVDKENAELKIVKGQGSMKLDTNALKEQILAALSSGQTELEFTTLSRQPERPDLQAIYTELSAEPVDAKYTDDGTFSVIEETVGCRFDVAAANTLWDQAQPGETVSIPLSITYPEVTAEKLESQLYRDLLGIMTTDYTASVENRKNNVRLATSKIDGLIMYPGDEFSYNTVVGARTTEAGFLSAPAYSNGEVVEEIGGGACQVSSTLYSATLFANLEITDRTCHYFRVTYMQLGTDATVTIPDEGNAIDFCFRNNRNYPIKIVGRCEENEDGSSCKVTFEIWGTLEEGDYEFVDFNNSNQYGWDNQWSYQVETEPTGEFPLAKIRLVTDLYSATDEAVGRSCTRTLTYRVITDLDGNEISNECVNPLLSTGGPAMDTYYNH